jgi:hypothetical protein
MRSSPTVIAMVKIPRTSSIDVCPSGGSSQHLKGDVIEVYAKLLRDDVSEVKPVSLKFQDKTLIRAMISPACWITRNGRACKLHEPVGGIGTLFETFLCTAHIAQQYQRDVYSGNIEVNGIKGCMPRPVWLSSGTS